MVWNPIKEKTVQTLNNFLNKIKLWWELKIETYDENQFYVSYLNVEDRNTFDPYIRYGHNSLEGHESRESLEFHQYPSQSL